MAEPVATSYHSWDDTLFYKHDRVQRYWAQQPVAADLCGEQWELVLISCLNNGRMTWSLTDTHRAAGSILQTGEASSHSNNTAKNISSSSFFLFQPLLCVLAPLALITQKLTVKL